MFIIVVYRRSVFEMMVHTGLHVDSQVGREAVFATCGHVDRPLHALLLHVVSALTAISGAHVAVAVDEFLRLTASGDIHAGMAVLPDAVVHAERYADIVQMLFAGGLTAGVLTIVVRLQIGVGDAAADAPAL